MAVNLSGDERVYTRGVDIMDALNIARDVLNAQSKINRELRGIGVDPSRGTFYAKSSEGGGWVEVKWTQGGS